MGFIGILKKYLHFHISYSIILNCQEHGGIPEWPKGADCKSVGNAFEGSNPSPTTCTPQWRNWQTRGT